MAFCRPRRLATFIAQAFSQDHFFTRRQHDLRRFIEQRSHHAVTAQGDAADAMAFARLIEHRRQSQSRSDGLRVAEAGRDIDGAGESQRNDRPDARNRHQAPAGCRHP